MELQKNGGKERAEGTGIHDVAKTINKQKMVEDTIS